MYPPDWGEDPTPWYKNGIILYGTFIILFILVWFIFALNAAIDQIPTDFDFTKPE